MEQHRPFRFAVVGLGHIAQSAVLPAFEQTRMARLAAVVSGDAEKRAAVGRRYDVPAVDYDDYGALLDGGEIDAVYVAVPNHLHARYAIPALRRGIHVLCEKPLEVSEAECVEMAAAADEGQAVLMTAKRLHFDPANLRAVELARSGELGELRMFSSFFGQRVTAGDVRLEPAGRGGGPVYDMGIYCINAARYLFGDEPVAVSAQASAPHDERFDAVEATFSAILAFPGARLAQFTASFDTERVARYSLLGTEGELSLTNAYEYAKPMTLEVRKGGEVTRREEFPPGDQFGPEIDYFCECVRHSRAPEPGIDDARADIRIITAIHEAARTGGTQHLVPVPQYTRPHPAMARHYPPVEKPQEVHASAPSE